MKLLLTLSLLYFVNGILSKECSHDGKVYEEGVSFPSNDGCNTCFCEGNGFVSCTEGCLPGNTPGTCFYNGQTYKTGDAFAAIDKCNQCTCERDQRVVCTKKACVKVKAKCTTKGGEVHEEGDTVPSDDGCNTCVCTMTGMFVCTLKACEDTAADNTPILDTHGDHHDHSAASTLYSPVTALFLCIIGMI